MTSSRAFTSACSALALALLLAAPAAAQGISAGGGGGGTFPMTGNVGAIGAVSTDAITLTNTQAATAGAQQWSPRFHWIAQGWKVNATAGSQTTDIIAESVPIQGLANPGPTLRLSGQTNGLGYTYFASFGPGSNVSGAVDETACVLCLKIGASGAGSLGPIPGSDHINITRNGNGVSLGFGTWNGAADLGQLGEALNGFATNTVQYTTVNQANAGSFGTGDASGANTPGGLTTIYGGRSTGSGAGGSIAFQTSPATGSSSTVNTAAVALTIDSAGHLNNPQNFGAPTCLTNCGTSPAIAGGDLNGIVTMGASGVPASGWVLTFAKPFAAAPSCSVTSALTTMVVGKMPIAVQTSTLSMTVTTNGTAPANSDKYAYDCKGVQ